MKKVSKDDLNIRGLGEKIAHKNVGIATLANLMQNTNVTIDKWQWAIHAWKIYMKIIKFE